MAIPLIYNIRSVRERWTSNLIAILSIAGVVAVFVAILSMAKGFQLTLVESGSPLNAIVRRGGAQSEMDSIISLEQLQVMENAPGVARSSDGKPQLVGEVVVVAAFHHKASDSDALAQLRGLSPMALQVHDAVKIDSGRFFTPGLAELVVGKNASRIYDGFLLDDTPKFGGRTWRVVGIMDAGGSAFDSEIWCDQSLLSQTYQRPVNIFSTVTARLSAPAAFQRFKDALTSDPRLDVQVEREVDYYAKQSGMISTLIRVLGFLVAFIMGIGAVFSAFNTIYSAIAARSRELATIRALGFGASSVVFSMLFESLFIALIGGVLGCVIILPINGLTTSTVNWQTFSQLAFAFRVTPDLLIQGISFSLLMGFLGGLVPAIRAARRPIAPALREL
jgi:putative ABC transport system permease protein